MILVINAGSSSLKFCLFQDAQVVKQGEVDRIGEKGKALTHLQAWEELYQTIAPMREEIKAVGHRIVHGGDKYHEPIRLTPEVVEGLKVLIPLAPLHLPPELEVIETMLTVLAGIPQIGIFDTAFFNQLPERAYTYPLPNEVCRRYNIRRFGFHGISHRYALRKAQEELGLIRTQRLVSVHLGAGCSVAAIREGVCIDTSMGFTPAEGLMMMTRAGDLDYGIIFHWLRQGMKPEEIEKMLQEQSGVKGVAGVSDDMRDILFLGGYKVEDEGYVPPPDLDKSEAVIGRARLAVEMFVYRVIKYVGAYVAVLGGLDALVMTGAIGAGSLEVRNLIVGALKYLNDYEVLVVEPNEEEEMRREVEEKIKK